MTRSGSATSTPGCALSRATATVDREVGLDDLEAGDEIGRDVVRAGRQTLMPVVVAPADESASRRDAGEAAGLEPDQHASRGRTSRRRSGWASSVSTTATGSPDPRPTRRPARASWRRGRTRVPAARDELPSDPPRTRPLRGLGGTIPGAGFHPLPAGTAYRGTIEVTPTPPSTSANPSDVDRARAPRRGRASRRGARPPGSARKPVADACGPSERVIDCVAHIANAVASTPLYSRNRIETGLPADALRRARRTIASIAAGSGRRAAATAGGRAATASSGGGGCGWSPPPTGSR